MNISLITEHTGVRQGRIHSELTQNNAFIRFFSNKTNTKLHLYEHHYFLFTRFISFIFLKRQPLLTTYYQIVDYICNI